MCERDTHATLATLKVTRIDEVEDLAKSPDFERTVDLSAPLAPLELEPGHWSVAVVSPGVWHQRQYLTVSGPTTLTLDVWPKATVSGRIRTAAKTPPREITVRFEKAAEDAPSGEGEPCLIEGNAFRCAIPAAPIHLRLRATGHVALYFWSTHLTAGANRDLGLLSLREGQSITGRIDLPREFRADWKDVVVRARPAAARAANTPSPFESPMLVPVTGRVTERGFFHLDGVSPGGWVVVAKQPNRRLFSEEVPVTVIAGADASLTRPLVLDRGRRLELAIQPPLDPNGRPWVVSTVREVLPGHVEAVLERASNPGGQWQAEGLLPGRYTATVRTSDGDVWSNASITLGPGDVFLPMNMALQVVRGEVTVGGNPVQAKLHFLHEEGGGARTTSDEEGRFAVRLPDARAHSWDVEIEADQPYVDRTVERLRIDDDDLRIRLSDGTIRGEVVDEAGTAVPHPLIHFLRSAGAVDVFGTEAGTFSITGLAPGVDEVQAEARGNQWSERIRVSIPEEGEAEPLRLVVLNQKEVRGIVASDFGPVSGAAVLVRSTDVPPGLVPTRTTDVEGRFTAHIPPSSAEFDLFVNAPGFSFMMDRMRYRDSILRATIDQMGGTVVVSSNATATIWLVHGGATAQAESIARQTNGSASKTQIVLPRMEPGPYSACVVPEPRSLAFRTRPATAAERCVSGVLAPNGSLTLSLDGNSQTSPAAP